MTKDELIRRLRRWVEQPELLIEVFETPASFSVSDHHRAIFGVKWVIDLVRSALADYDAQEEAREIARVERARIRSMRIRNVRPMVLGARAVIPLAARGVVGMLRR